MKENPWLTEKEKIKEELGEVEAEIEELKNQKQKLEDYFLDQANYVSPSETTGVFELWTEFIKVAKDLARLQKQSESADQHREAKELFEKRKKSLLLARQFKRKINTVYYKCEKLMETDLQLQRNLTKKEKIQEKAKEMLSNPLEVKQNQQLQAQILQINLPTSGRGGNH